MIGWSTVKSNYCTVQVFTCDVKGGWVGGGEGGVDTFTVLEVIVNKIHDGVVSTIIVAITKINLLVGYNNNIIITITITILVGCDLMIGWTLTCERRAAHVGKLGDISIYNF